MNTLCFEKLSQFDRKAEPVTVSIPFAQGKLKDPRHLAVLDEGEAIPAQRRALASWPDGSVKWLLAHLQPDLPGNRDKTLHFEVSGEPVDRQPEVSVGLTNANEGMAIAAGAGSAEGPAPAVRVDTGPLSFVVPIEGFWPVQEVTLDGDRLWQERPFQGFVLQHNGRCLRTDSGPVVVEIEEAGPLRAVILVRGRHRKPDGSGYVEMHGRITTYAGKPYVEIEHQFIHTEEEAELSLEALRLGFEPETSGSQPRLALGQGYYRTAIEESTENVSMDLDAETMLYQSNEHFIDSFYGDFWTDWRDASGGLTLSIHQAHQNFPKRLEASRGGIVCSLYPEWAKPAPLLQGMGKTHRIQLHFHAADTPLEAVSVRSLQFQLPDRPSLTRAWFRENNPWVETFFPERLPSRLITYFNGLHDGRPKALGMFHFGDAPDSGYTDQGRGRGENVWVNNEYDRPHCCTLFYGLTGQRRALDSALVSARHWLDVDLCHYSADPLLHGGLKVHTRYHVTGGVTPSHEWTEGFLDYYFLTGRREGLDGARSVAENIMRHMERPEMRRPGDASVREGGWALRAMVGMWLGTGEEKWKAEAGRIVKTFLDWFDQHGALLAPYTSHSMPRVPFMISLTVNSLARYLLIEDDARVKQLIVSVVDDLIEHCLGPDGIFYYKELPSLQRTSATSHALESLTHAYRITGDESYLKVAARQFDAAGARGGGGWGGAKYADPSGAVIAGRGGGRVFSTNYTSYLLFAGEATPLGLLDWYDYAFGDLAE
jgi:hypothetical protein